MSIDQQWQLMLWLLGGTATVVSGLLVWVVNKRENRIDKFIETTTETLTELKIITQVHEAEIENLKDAVFVVKYPKTDKI